jgi:hypothetical protein
MRHCLQRSPGNNLQFLFSLSYNCKQCNNKTDKKAKVSVQSTLASVASQLWTEPDPEENRLGLGLWPLYSAESQLIQREWKGPKTRRVSPPGQISQIALYNRSQTSQGTFRQADAQAEGPHFRILCTFSKLPSQEGLPTAGKLAHASVMLFPSSCRGGSPSGPPGARS